MKRRIGKILLTTIVLSVLGLIVYLLFNTAEFDIRNYFNNPDDDDDEPELNDKCEDEDLV